MANFFLLWDRNSRIIKKFILLFIRNTRLNFSPIFLFFLSSRSISLCFSSRTKLFLSPLKYRRGGGGFISCKCNIRPQNSRATCRFSRVVNYRSFALPFCVSQRIKTTDSWTTGFYRLLTLAKYKCSHNSLDYKLEDRSKMKFLKKVPLSFWSSSNLYQRIIRSNEKRKVSLRKEKLPLDNSLLILYYNNITYIIVISL